MANESLTTAQSDLLKLAALEDAAHRAREAAERAWHELFCALPIGAERIYAGEVFERIRVATRRTA